MVSKNDKGMYYELKEMSSAKSCVGVSGFGMYVITVGGKD